MLALNLQFKVKAENLGTHLYEDFLVYLGFYSNVLFNIQRLYFGGTSHCLLSTNRLKLPEVVPVRGRSRQRPTLAAR
jgi:hypothetical protein